MKKTIFFILFLITIHLPAEEYNIVFIHIGEQLPTYLQDAVNQTKMFNSHVKIYVLVNSDNSHKLANTWYDKNIIVLSYETLSRSPMHKKFIEQTSLNKTALNGFWLFCSERFFYLDELITHCHLKNVFHLESDNLLYVNLKTLLPIFSEYYPGIAATFDNDTRCIAGFIYFSSAHASKKLVDFMACHAQEGLNDMEILARFKQTHKKQDIASLPITTREYIQNNSLKSLEGHVTRVPQEYCNHLSLFNSIFDAATIGQYLGGIDPIHENSQPGFINESCLFNPSFFKFFWKIDEKKRKVPYLEYKGKIFRINNLHIHSKNLRAFMSL